MTIFIDQFLSEKSEIDGKANTLAMVFVRYTMDHDCRAYGTPIIIHGISTRIYSQGGITTNRIVGKLKYLVL